MPGMIPKSINGTSSARNTCQRQRAIRNNSRMMTPTKAIRATIGSVATAVDSSTVIGRQKIDGCLYAAAFVGNTGARQTHFDANQRAGEH